MAKPDAGSGGVDAGGGSDAGSGSVATLAGFCLAYGGVTCDRLFECDPAGSAAGLATVAQCKAELGSLCGSATCTSPYNPSLGMTCVTDVMTASCAVITSAASFPNCDSACPNP
jgi:hypothetical protein